MEQKRELSWQDVDRLSADVARMVVVSGFEPEVIVGIAVGGFVPAVLLAKRLAVHDIAAISASSYVDGVQKELHVWHIPDELKDKRVLVVDEIADSGKTLQEVVRILKRRCGVRELKTATLCVREDKCAFGPDFSSLAVSEWVVFPWDSVHSES